MQMVSGFFTMMKQIKSKKVLLPMALKRVNGQRGLKMEEQQRDTIQMEKKTQLGLAGGIMIGLERKCRVYLRAEK